MCSRRCTLWDESFPRTPAYREVNPPRPVTINLDQAVARDNPPLRTVNPLWVTAYSIKLTGYCPGLLHAWLRLGTGVWLAECSCVVHSPNNDARHNLRQWMPASALQPVRPPHDASQRTMTQHRQPPHSGYLASAAVGLVRTYVGHLASINPTVLLMSVLPARE